MKTNMYGEMRAAAYDLLDAIRRAHTGQVQPRRMKSVSAGAKIPI
jgi:hypothetical protein